MRRSRGPALRDARVIVTGASSGIGEALALRLASRGAALALIVRSFDERVERLCDRIAEQGDARPVVVTADLAEPGAGGTASRTAIEKLGGVDVLVNNAGGGAGGTTWRAADGAEARDAFEINYWTPLALIAEAVPVMLKQKSGVVLNVTSMGQVMTWPMMGPYTATKAALASATETLRLEIAGTGVRVIEVIPGPVATAVQAESALLPGFSAAMRFAPLGDRDVLAERVVRAIEGSADRVIYPGALWGAYTLPSLTRRFVARLARGHGDSIHDERVIRSGSRGDAAARAARKEWTEAHE